MKGRLDKKPEKDIEIFNTTTGDLLKLLDWIEERKCTHVAMESTGVYWKPVWNVLEVGSFEMILANARHIKNLLGRKTDVKDAEWIAQLLRSGLVNKSFVPNESIRDLRDLTRYRKKIMYEINREKNRIHKILEDCNVKISSYLSDIFGDTGRRILNKIIDQEEIKMTDLIEISSGRGKASIRAKLGDLKEAVTGKAREHHLAMIKYSYTHIEFLENQVKEIEAEIDEYVKPYYEEIDILDTIPGINKNAASVIIAVIHTFSRDLKWNPHVHALVTEGAIDKNNKWWKSVEYIPYPFLKKAWQKVLLDIIKKHFD